MKSIFNVAPSKLTFLLDDCDRCFWNDIHKVWKRPYTPFPSVFGKIDKAMREVYGGLDPASICGDLPHGTLDCTDRTLNSKPLPVPSGNLIQFSGRLDALARFHNGTLGVLDFKTSESSDRAADLYRRQLHAYAQMLQDPLTGHPSTVTQIGLLCAAPTTAKLDESGDRLALSFALNYRPLDLNWDWWLEFVHRLDALLSGPCPEPDGECPYCAMQQAIAQQQAEAENPESKQADSGAKSQ